MKKLFILICLGFVINVYATPDYERTITEVVLGKNNQGIVIYQVIKDSTKLGEEYILIKEIIEVRLVLKQQILVKSILDIQQIIQAKDFELIIPDLFQEKYLHIYGNKEHIYFLGTSYDIFDILPKELWSFSVDRIESFVNYKEYKLIILLLVSENGFEKIRKVLVLKLPKD